MPTFEKSPAALVERFDEVVARHPAGQRRQMFGYPALFAGGNLATSLFRDRWVLRLAPEDAAEALALPGAESFAPRPGRPMRDWVLLPRETVGDDASLDEWVGRAMAFAASLPPKG
jgi:hypothetical protein